MAIGPVLKALLAEKGMTAYRLAELSGVGSGHIGQMLSGRIKNPQGPRVLKLATALGVEPGVLLRGAKEAAPVPSPAVLPSRPGSGRSWFSAGSSRSSSSRDDGVIGPKRA